MAPIPALNIEGFKPGGKPLVNNDEVAAILRGLQLNHDFFKSRLQPIQSVIDSRPEKGSRQGSRRNSLAQVPEGPTSDDGLPSPSSPKNERRSSWLVVPGDLKRGVSDDVSATVSPRSSQRKKDVEARSTNNRRRQSFSGKPLSKDFDVYVGEGVMPVLAQSLDALTRQLNRMDKQGDNLDPKVRARFNPLTFLAQQLLRRHPKAARTPRRQALYKNFSEWADWERGRRELLRRKDIIEEAFNGFILPKNSGVQVDTLPSVIEAIDDTLALDGKLKTSLKDFFGGVSTPSAANSGLGISEAQKKNALKFLRKTHKRKSTFFQGECWSWDKFWSNFSDAVLKHDCMRYTVVEAGAKKIQSQVLARWQHEQAKRAEAEAQRQEEIAQQKRLEEYTEFYKELSSNEQLRAIVDQDKILTGDDVRPHDAGYEFEVPPKGPHCVLLAKLLTMLGFKDVHHCDLTDGVDNHERWWTEELANNWAILQDLHGAELLDGVVEKEVLSQVMVDPVGFTLLRRNVEYELGIIAEDNENFGAGSRPHSKQRGSAMHVGVKKPSMEDLCARLAIPMARMKWLHQLFEGFLQPDDQDDDTPPVACGYPGNPAALNKDQMKALIKEVKPDIEESEFEAKFARIDEDGSQEIEFDEFVIWVREDEVRIVGTSDKKFEFSELAELHDQPLELIMYLHDCFQDQLPEEEECNYPSQPASMAKASVRELVTFLTPDTSDADFEANFSLMDVNQKECVVFDEFLDMIDMSELPDELLQQAGVA